MNNLTMCGYCCDLCKAFAPNIKKDDKRSMLASAWKKYYDLHIPACDIYCDGCRCNKADSKRIDNNCPVRACVLENNILHCGECSKHPCNTFSQREGLTEREANEKCKEEFDPIEYKEYLLAYDNKTRIQEFKKNKIIKNKT